MRCFNCNQFNHHTSKCKNIVSCVVCAQNHHSNQCINKFKKGEQTHKKCSNCGLNHMASYRGCPTRMQLIKLQKATATDRFAPKKFWKTGTVSQTLINLDWHDQKWEELPLASQQLIANELYELIVFLKNTKPLVDQIPEAQDDIPDKNEMGMISIRDHINLLHSQLCYLPPSPPQADEQS